MIRYCSAGAHADLIRRALALIAILVCGAVCMAREYAPEEIDNPNVRDYREFVADPEGMLSPSVRQRINMRLLALRDSTDAEVAVAIVPSIGDMPVEEFSERLFTRWGLGAKDRDNGLLLLISPGSRRARIQTGYGMEGVVPDIVAGEIMRSDIVPAMREGDLDRAADEATRSLAKIIADPQYAGELKSGLERPRQRAAEESLDPAVIKTFAGWMVVLVTLGALVWFVICVRRTSGMIPYERAMAWRRNMNTFLILTVLSLGGALIFVFLALWKYRRARTGRRKCRECGGWMHRLPEDEDNAYLTPAQDLEERLGSVDYDVWKCGTCGNTEVYPFPGRQTKYTRCPKCGTVAMHEVGTRVIRPATHYSEGIGEKVYRCENCGHNDHRRYRIPKRPDERAALLGAAAALAAGRGRRGGGGGFGGGGFGGGFGGGSTGGGGASGSW